MNHTLSRRSGSALLQCDRKVRRLNQPLICLRGAARSGEQKQTNEIPTVDLVMTRSWRRGHSKAIPERASPLGDASSAVDAALSELSTNPARNFAATVKVYQDRQQRDG